MTNIVTIENDSFVMGQKPGLHYVNLETRKQGTGDLPETQEKYSINNVDQSADISELLLVWNTKINQATFFNIEKRKKVKFDWSKDAFLMFLDCSNFTQFDYVNQTWKPI